MTQECGESTCSGATEPLKPWTDVTALGEQIVRELGLERSVDTLGRWMAHRVAELMARAEDAPSEEVEEQARRDCTDVIMRLWERRDGWPSGQPLAKVAAFLMAFTAEQPRREHSASDAPPGSWLAALPKLLQIHDREETICRDAALAELDPDALASEKAWLEAHSGDLSADERDGITTLLELRSRTESEHYRLDGKSAPRFASLPTSRKAQLVREAFANLEAERSHVLKEVQFRAPAAQDD